MSPDTKPCRRRGCRRWLTAEQFTNKEAYCSADCRRKARNAQLNRYQRQERRRKRQG